MKKKVLFILFLISILFISGCGEKEVIKIGWISDLTGPVAKYGAYEAGMLAVEEINAKGGINGQPIQLIVEDGKCNGKTAVTAMNKLVNVDKVKIVLGGHCTPESASIAPIAEENKVIMLASITTSPVLTNMGDYVFRTSPVSVQQSKLIADLAYNELGLRNFAIIYEQTDYARPIAEKLRDEFSKNGGKIALFEAYNPGVTDFRTLLSKVKEKNTDALFLSAQSPDAALNFMKQAKELDINIKLFGNDVAGTQAIVDQIPEAYEDFILAQPDFDLENSKTKEFIETYKEKYKVDNIPYGIWTAESYDAVYIIADAISKYGTDPELIKEYLYNLKDYQGVSGSISIDENGDGIREYELKIIKDGKQIDYS